MREREREKNDTNIYKYLFYIYIYYSLYIYIYIYRFLAVLFEFPTLSIGSSFDLHVARPPGTFARTPNTCCSSTRKVLSAKL